MAANPRTSSAGAGPRAGFNATYVWSISAVAAMGGLLFGYDWIVISGTDLFYEAHFHLTSALQVGWAKSSALLGCLLGALLSGALSDRFGRKRLLILSALLFAVSSVATGLAGSFGVFVLWRIAGGAAIGLASSLSPMYIAEVAPAHARGSLVSLNQLTIVIGILLAQFVNWQIGTLHPLPEQPTADQIAASWSGQTGWRWMFAVTALPSLLFLIGVFFVPESPRWLAKNGSPERARVILAKIGGGDYARAALAEIRATLANEGRQVSFRDLLEPRLRRTLFLGIALAVLQQWCGINVIFYYAKDVFKDSGFKVADILISIVFIGSVNLLATLVALKTVDRWGRRPLMLFGYAGLTGLFVIMGLCFAMDTRGVHMLVIVLLAIACYAMSLAPITWVLIAEIFPNRIRGAAMSVAVTSLWIACFVLTETFPLLREKLGPAVTFWIYAAICLSGFLWLRSKLPETKGKTLEELEQELAA
ncbi:MAG TPA: sugar porter family MFS transporter [Verrucomicrobiota bacterium]|jgi:sugar porter (SP) family MFS transporter|nr:sugar porter family MFS transporter [Verrucomicrobiota bacterium]HQL79388.1 sugar porter family MFS transporter [Verrucomicrobiota bacterium]